MAGVLHDEEVAAGFAEQVPGREGCADADGWIPSLAPKCSTRADQVGALHRAGEHAGEADLEIHQIEEYELLEGELQHVGELGG